MQPEKKSFRVDPRLWEAFQEWLDLNALKQERIIEALLVHALGISAEDQRALLRQAQEWKAAAEGLAKAARRTGGGSADRPTTAG